jgi:hypothetical protein
MPLPFDPTDPVMAAFHACFIQGGYSTPEIEAGRMKTDCQRISDAQLVAWAEEAGLPTDGSREDVQRRMCDRIDERLAAYEARASQTER